MTVELLEQAGWASEDFDGSPSAVYDNDQIECRVVIDEDGDAFLLLGEFDSEAIQLYTMSGPLEQAFSVLSAEAPHLTVDGVPALISAIAHTDVEITAADGIVVDPEHLGAMERLAQFREAFFQIFPYGDAEHAGAYAANDEVGLTVLEHDQEPGWIVEFIDLDDQEMTNVSAWLVPATPENAAILINAIPELTKEAVPALVESLSPTKQMEAVD